MFHVEHGTILFHKKGEKMANQQTFVTKKEFKAYQKYCEKVFKSLLKEINKKSKSPSKPKKPKT